jgi:hypothetical protein
MRPVCQDVSTTRRKPLTPSQKLKLYEAQKGICPLCDRRMERGEKLIDEHLQSLGLAGSNDLSNRAMVHATCAYAKTFGSEGDIAKIAEAKRRKARSLGLTAPKRPIQSRGFGKAPKQNPTRAPEKWTGCAFPART